MADAGRVNVVLTPEEEAGLRPVRRVVFTFPHRADLGQNGLTTAKEMLTELLQRVPEAAYENAWARGAEVQVAVSMPPADAERLAGLLALDESIMLPLPQRLQRAPAAESAGCTHTRVLVHRAGTRRVTVMMSNVSSKLGVPLLRTLVQRSLGDSVNVLDVSTRIGPGPAAYDVPLRAVVDVPLAWPFPGVMTLSGTAGLLGLPAVAISDVWTTGRAPPFEAQMRLGPRARPPAPAGAQQARGGGGGASGSRRQGAGGAASGRRQPQQPRAGGATGSPTQGAGGAAIGRKQPQQPRAGGATGSPTQGAGGAASGRRQQPQQPRSGGATGSPTQGAGGAASGPKQPQQPRAGGATGSPPQSQGAGGAASGGMQTPTGASSRSPPHRQPPTGSAEAPAGSRGHAPAASARAARCAARAAARSASRSVSRSAPRSAQRSLSAVITAAGSSIVAVASGTPHKRRAVEAGPARSYLAATCGPQAMAVDDWPGTVAELLAEPSPTHSDA